MAQQEIIPPGPDPEYLRRDGLIAYALYAAGLIFGVAAVAGVIFAYIKRDTVRGTYLDSHMVWLIRTFWTALVLGIVGLLLSYLIVGIPILILTAIWYVYRVVKGFAYFNDGKSFIDPSTFL